MKLGCDRITKWIIFRHNYPSWGWLPNFTKLCSYIMVRTSSWACVQLQLDPLSECTELTEEDTNISDKTQQMFLGIITAEWIFQLWPWQRFFFFVLLDTVKRGIHWTIYDYECGHSLRWCNMTQWELKWCIKHLKYKTQILQCHTPGLFKISLILSPAGETDFWPLMSPHKPLKTL